MLTFHKTVGSGISRIEELESGCWVNMINPTEEEMQYIISALDIDSSFIRAALDEEETSRVEVEEGQTLIIIDVPSSEKQQDGGVIFSTLPMSIIVAPEHIITVCLKETSIVRDISEGVVRNVQTTMKTRFILMLLLRAANRYLHYLRQIEKISSHVERQLYKSLKNKELILLLDLEKSLVYFSTSLKSTEVTLEKILRGRIIKLYEDDQDLLEDVLIEFKQALEMTKIHASILSGTMDAFASLISNNLNINIRILTIITILITIPNIIFSYYGMNVTGLPYANHIFPIVLAAGIVALVWTMLKKRKMF